MAFSTRSLSGHLRQGSASGNIASQSTGQSSALQARINEKKAELENLRELRDLSAAVANQMEALETKLSTLSDGTDAKIPKPREPTDDQGELADEEETIALPQTLVRIPTEHAPTLQAQADNLENEHSSSTLT
ncbi:Vacuolar protein sorting-associated protein 29 [Pestalotiopsis sp. IQ-011]